MFFAAKSQAFCQKVILVWFRSCSITASNKKRMFELALFITLFLVMAVEESRQFAAREEVSRAHEYSVKLFGMKISLSLDGKPDDQAAAPAGGNELKCEEEAASTVEDLASFSGSSDEDKAPLLEGKVTMDNVQFGGCSQSKQNEQQDAKNKTLRKPDKPVPCPRCNSLDTKFCYFNNYNVNQPRHFCKHCQRYWTAGGTLRNVPVGAGRRKNKQVGQQRLDCVLVRGDPHDAAQKPLQSEKRAAKLQSLASKMHVPVPGGEADGKNVLHAPGYSFCANGLLQRQGFTTGAEASMESKVQHSLSNTSEGSNDSRDESTCGSSVSNPAQECKESNSHPAWPFALLNGACGWGAAPHFCNSENGLFSSNSTSAAGNGLWPGFPWPVIRGPAWNPAGWNGAWNTPWGCMAASAAAAAAKAIANVGSLPTALGKHPRDDAESRTEGCLWAPKSLRIDDLGQAARSNSFLASLGLDNKQETTTSEGMFQAFQHNTSSKFTDEEISAQVDPAAAKPTPNTLEEETG